MEASAQEGEGNTLAGINMDSKEVVVHMLKVELEVFSLAKGALEANTSLSSSLFLCLA